MPLFRKRPVVIEAIQYTGHNGWNLRNWSKDAVVESPVLEPSVDNPRGEYVQIQTSEGCMIGNVGDWIIRGTKGEFYPCKPNIFEEIYEKAEVPNA